MYRAKAEIVNGLRVFAGGQWLTCIGNKNVRVGDFIWTDGRCVYGFNNISQQPLVILAPQLDDWGIPIVLKIPDAAEPKAYIFTKSGLQEIGVFQSSTAFHISNNSTDKIYKAGVNKLASPRVLAFNIKNNDIYILQAHWTYEDYYYLEVLKNNEVMKSIGNLKNPFGAFIEDDKNWTVFSWGQSTDENNSYYRYWKEYHYFAPYCKYPYCPIPPNYSGIIFTGPIIINVTLNHYETYRYSEILLHNSSESSIVYSVSEHSLYEYEYYESDYTVIVAPHVYDLRYGDCQASKFIDHGLQINYNHYFNNLAMPMHNGFYYVVNYIYHDPETPEKRIFHTYPTYYNVSVFSPSARLLFTEDFSTSSKDFSPRGKLPYIVACEINSGKYLVGLQNLKDKVDGLYIVSNNILELVQAGTILNQKLEKMKNYKDWLNRIQVIEGVQK